MKHSEIKYSSNAFRMVKHSLNWSCKVTEEGVRLQFMVMLIIVFCQIIHSSTKMCLKVYTIQRIDLLVLLTICDFIYFCHYTNLIIYYVRHSENKYSFKFILSLFYDRKNTDVVLLQKTVNWVFDSNLW